MQRDDARHLALVRWHVSWSVAFLFAAIWNFVLPALPTTRPAPPFFETVGHVAGCAFLFLAFRAFVARTRIKLDENGLDVRNAWAPWSKLTMPLADVAGFETTFHEAEGHMNVSVRLRSGDRKELPVDWQPIPLSLKGSKKRWFVEDHEAAAAVTRELEDMLLRARQLGHDTFRT